MSKVKHRGMAVLSRRTVDQDRQATHVSHENFGSDLVLEVKPIVSVEERQFIDGVIDGGEYVRHAQEESEDLVRSHQYGHTGRLRSTITIMHIFLAINAAAYAITALVFLLIGFSVSAAVAALTLSALFVAISSVLRSIGRTGLEARSDPNS